MLKIAHQSIAKLLTSGNVLVYTYHMRYPSWSKKKIISLAFVLVISLSILTLLGHAAFAVDSIQFDPQGTIKNELKLPDKSPVDITIRVIQWVLGLLGLVAVIMIMLGGFMWMTSAGNEERVKKSKTILTSAIIGMIIIMTSWALITFVINKTNDVTTDIDCGSDIPCAVGFHKEPPSCQCVAD
ncbi:MAG: pilin [Patescibacteria group bacterium]